MYSSMEGKVEDESFSRKRTKITPGNNLWDTKFADFDVLVIFSQPFGNVHSAFVGPLTFAAISTRLTPPQKREVLTFTTKSSGCTSYPDFMKNWLIGLKRVDPFKFDKDEAGKFLVLDLVLIDPNPAYSVVWHKPLVMTRLFPLLDEETINKMDKNTLDILKKKDEEPSATPLRIVRSHRCEYLKEIWVEHCIYNPSLAMLHVIQKLRDCYINNDGDLCRIKGSERLKYEEDLQQMPDLEQIACDLNNFLSFLDITPHEGVHSSPYSYYHKENILFMGHRY